MNKTQEKMISMVDFDRFFETVKITSELPEEKIDKDIIQSYLETWAKEKEWLFVRFGEKLTMETPLDVPPRYDDTENFLRKIMKEYPMYAAAISTFSTHDFVNNSVGEVDKDSYLYTYFPTIYKVGAKPSKILSKILQNPQFDIDLSKELQNRTSTGRAVVSIDPIDYALVSTSNHNWISCMCILKGFNKFGGYSLMMDNCTVVAYHCGVSETMYSNKYGSLAWNNKISRQLMFIKESGKNKKDVTVHLGHNLQNPSYACVRSWIGLLSRAFGETLVEKENNRYFQAESAGEFYYDRSIYGTYVIGKPTEWVPKIGVNKMKCIRCGKEFSKLVGYHGWLTCNGHKGE